MIWRRALYGSGINGPGAVGPALRACGACRASVSRTKAPSGGDARSWVTGTQLRTHCEDPRGVFGRHAEPARSAGPPVPGISDAQSLRSTILVRTLSTLAAVMIGGSSRLLACPVCFGAEEGSIIDGTRVGILVLLAITFVVQGGFLGFFFYLRRRARLNRDEDLEAEWAELQRASRTS